MINYADVYVPKQDGEGSEWQYFLVGHYFEFVDGEGDTLKTIVREIYVADNQITIICDHTRVIYSGFPYKVFYEK